MNLSKNARMKLFQQTTGWSTDKMRANKKAVNDIVGDDNGGGPSNAITYDEQDLSEGQKAQARENIGAAEDKTLVLSEIPSDGALSADWVEDAFRGKYDSIYIFQEGYYDEEMGEQVLDKYVIAPLLLNTSSSEWGESYITFELPKVDVSNIHTVYKITRYPNGDITVSHYDVALDISEVAPTLAPGTNSFKIWVGTQAQYDLITPANDTVYIIKP